MSENLIAENVNNAETSKNETLKPTEFREVLEKYGLEGSSPEGRVESLKKMSADQIVIMLTELNAKLLGSEETGIADKTMKVGEKPLVKPEYRYDLFNSLIEKISKSSSDLNPGRIADALALGIVMLHPFSDGNGRTARVLRLAFDTDYDASDYEESFKALAESRDVSRARSGTIIMGYVPNLGEGEDQENPNDVENYFGRLLSEENDYLYVGPYGYSSLKQKQNA